MLSANFSDNHKWHPAEQDANARALKYFTRKIPGYDGWKFGSNPIKGYDTSQPYNFGENQLALNRALLGIRWYDFAWIGGSSAIPNVIGHNF